MVRLSTMGDPELSGEVGLDGEGATDLPYCGRVLLARLEPGEAERTVAACLVSSGAYTEAPSISVTVTVSGAVRVRIGREQTARDVPFGRGLTVVGALGDVLVEGHPPALVRLERAGRAYVVDLEAIATGKRHDEPLEPNDVLTVKEELPMRPLPVERVAAHLPLGRPRPIPPGATCGAVLLEEAELRASGKGDRHHEVLAAKEAIAARCSDDTVTASLRSACMDARRRQAEWLAGGRSPGHPTVRALAAALRVCPPPDAAR
jgi:hypothetical protein